MKPVDHHRIAGSGGCLLAESRLPGLSAQGVEELADLFLLGLQLTEDSRDLIVGHV